MIVLSTGGNPVNIPAESDAWFAWLETARTFAFDDPVGRFTARKRRRSGADYWYAFRRLGGHLYETYLGKARDITVGRLRAVAARLNDLAGCIARLPVVAPEREVKRKSTRHTAATRTRERPTELPPPKLTPRQGQVLRLIAGGAFNNDIARELVISPLTVKRHVSNILMALNVWNRTQAVARARELHLLDPEGK